MQLSLENGIYLFIYSWHILTCYHQFLTTLFLNAWLNYKKWDQYYELKNKSDMWNVAN
jgi:hypothetical protein